MGKRTSNGMRLLALAFAATACAGQITSSSDTTGTDAGSEVASSETTAPEILADQSTPVGDDSPGSGTMGSSASPGSGGSAGGDDDASSSSSSSSSGGISNDSSGDDSGSSTVPDQGEEMDVFELEVGDCFNSLALDEVSEVDGLSCDKSHIYEVYHAFDIVADEFPGEDAVADEAADGCLASFESFVGTAYEDSFLDISYLYPTPESWSLGGDREVLCLVLNLDETPRTGTARGSEI